MLYICLSLSLSLKILKDKCLDILKMSSLACLYANLKSQISNHVKSSKSTNTHILAPINTLIGLYSPFSSFTNRIPSSLNLNFWIFPDGVFG